MFCFVDLSDLDNVDDVLPQHGCEKQRHHCGRLISALFVKTEHKQRCILFFITFLCQSTKENNIQN